MTSPNEIVDDVVVDIIRGAYAQFDDWMNSLPELEQHIILVHYHLHESFTMEDGKVELTLTLEKN